jgi:hypothetical protein
VLNGLIVGVYDLVLCVLYVKSLQTFYRHSITSVALTIGNCITIVTTIWEQGFNPLIFYKIGGHFILHSLWKIKLLCEIKTSMYQYLTCYVLCVACLAIYFVPLKIVVVVDNRDKSHAVPLIKMWN